MIWGTVWMFLLSYQFNKFFETIGYGIGITWWFRHCNIVMIFYLLQCIKIFNSIIGPHYINTSSLIYICTLSSTCKHARLCVKEFVMKVIIDNRNYFYFILLYYMYNLHVWLIWDVYLFYFWKKFSIWKSFLFSVV